MRGASNLLSVILKINISLRLDWLDTQSIPLAVLTGLYFIIVDIIPSVYLSFGIWLVTQEYLKSKMSETVLNSKTNGIFTVIGDEPMVNDDKEWAEDSLETSFDENELTSKSVN
mmetsp:Transcript_14012/g.12378  ORF Transcript_14012/g.12378 Transcript_14012/m.12378 type:complete len:114 (+) Transcript_14012:442-783(+)